MSIASKIEKLETDISNAYDAVEDKDGTIPSNKNTENLETAIRSIPSSSGSSVLNGVIEPFIAQTNTVEANTFVEIINSSSGITTKVIDDSANNTSDYVSTLLLDENRIFMTHRSSTGLNAIIITISKSGSTSTFTLGTDTSIATTTYSYWAYSALIDTNKVFIAYRGSSQRLYGIVCEINGTTITKGSETVILSTNYTYSLSVIKLDTNKVFITHRSRSICTLFKGYSM